MKIIKITDMVSGVIYQTNGNIIEKTFSKSNISLKDMQNIVKGHIEFVYLLKDNLVMVVNEQGKIMGLPFNAKATKLVKECNIKDIIVGDVLVINQNLIK